MNEMEVIQLEFARTNTSLYVLLLTDTITTNFEKLFKKFCYRLFQYNVNNSSIVSSFYVRAHGNT